MPAASTPSLRKYVGWSLAAHLTLSLAPQESLSAYVEPQEETIICGPRPFVYPEPEPDADDQTIAYALHMMLAPPGSGLPDLTRLYQSSSRAPAVWLREPRQRNVAIETAPSAAGALDTAMVERHVKRNRGAVEQCYRRALLDDTELRARVTLRFVVGTDGQVDALASDGPADLAECVARAIRTLRFPGGNESTAIVYPLAFAPAASR